MTIRVVRDQTAPMRHEIHIGRNSLATDGSVEEGGEGSGPSPHDLYDAALGAFRGLPSERATVVDRKPDRIAARGSPACRAKVPGPQAHDGSKNRDFDLARAMNQGRYHLRPNWYRKCRPDQNA